MVQRGNDHEWRGSDDGGGGNGVSTGAVPILAAVMISIWRGTYHLWTRGCELPPCTAEHAQVETVERHVHPRIKHVIIYDAARRKMPRPNDHRAVVEIPSMHSTYVFITAGTTLHRHAHSHAHAHPTAPVFRSLGYLMH